MTFLDMRRRLSGVAAGFIFASAVCRVHAQTEEPSAPAQKAEFRLKAPVSGNVLETRLPEPSVMRLKNGLTLMILEDHRAPVVVTELHVAGPGPMFEPIERQGLASLTAETMVRASAVRPAQELAQDLERLGVVLSSSAPAGSAEIVVRARGLSDHFDEWLSVFAEVVLRPGFPAGELAKVRERREAQQRRDATSPFLVAEQLLRRAVRGEHPTDRASGAPKLCAECNVEALKQWYRDRFAPQNAILGVVGDVKSSQVLAAVRKTLGSWTRSRLSPEAPLQKSLAAPSRAVYLVDRPDSTQTTICIGGLSPDRLARDYGPMRILNRLLGDGPGSRLHDRVREQRGLAYSVGSWLLQEPAPAMWRACAEVRTQSTTAALGVIMDELELIRRGDVAPEEVEHAKHSLVAAFAFSLEDPIAPSRFALENRHLGLPVGEANRFSERIMPVTADDVRAAARTYLDTSRLQIVAVGDVRRIRSGIAAIVPQDEMHTVQ
jgi:zinc protease